jgi:hypothetical protein
MMSPFAHLEVAFSGRADDSGPERIVCRRTSRRNMSAASSYRILNSLGSSPARHRPVCRVERPPTSARDQGGFDETPSIVIGS